MAYFNRDQRGGGGRSFGGGRRSFGGGGSDRGERQMHKAICSNCGRECEVPFNPTGNKPVYCSDCFEKFGRESGPRRFDDRDNRRPQFEQRGNDRPDRPQNNDQFRELNSKLDKILSLLQSKTELKPANSPSEFKNEEIINKSKEAIPEVKEAKPKAKKTKKSAPISPDENPSSNS